MPDSVKKPTGAIASPRHVIAGAMPHRITGSTPANFIVIPQTLSMWLNDVDGDCVTAEEAAAKAMCSVMSGQPELFITDQTVQAWATKHGVLDGAVISDVLDWMVGDGFSQGGTIYNDGQKTSVDWTNAATLQNAIYKGPVKIGVAADQLQNVVGSSNGWFATGFKKDTNIDHCPNLCGFGTLSWLANALGVTVPIGLNGSALGYALFTWKTIGIIDAASMIAITGEAWLRTPTTVTVGPTPTPIPPAPTPTPIPVPPPSGGITLADVLAADDAYFAGVIQRNRANAYIVNILMQIRSGIEAYHRQAFANRAQDTQNDLVVE